MIGVVDLMRRRRCLLLLETTLASAAQVGACCRGARGVDDGGVAYIKSMHGVTQSDQRG